MNIELEVKHINIKMTRGDTLNLKIQRQTEKEEIIKEKVDEMYVTLKKDYETKEYIFQKKLSNHTIEFNNNDFCYYFTIESKNTEKLSYGDYYFDVEIENNRKIKTIIKGILTLTEEVTFSINRGTK